MAHDRENHDHTVSRGKQLYLIGKKLGRGESRRDRENEGFFSATESEPLVALQHTLSDDQDVRVVHVIGSDDDPQVLVVEMLPERAEQLKGEHPDLIVEEDTSLDIL